MHNREKGEGPIYMKLLHEWGVLTGNNGWN